MKAVRLRTEYLENPIGIDIVAPRLYWNAEGGTKQTAYQIIAKSGDKIIWNTGKVASSRMTHILRISPRRKGCEAVRPCRQVFCPQIP